MMQIMNLIGKIMMNVNIMFIKHISMMELHHLAQIIQTYRDMNTIYFSEAEIARKCAKWLNETFRKD